VPCDFSGACRAILVDGLEDTLNEILIGLGETGDSAPRSNKVTGSFHPPAEQGENFQRQQAGLMSPVFKKMAPLW
jgi:hypothetical protein